MWTSIWRAVQGRDYGHGMGRPEKLTPERQRPADLLERWAGAWVAIKDGEVIAAAHNARELVPQLHEMGAAAEGAVARYVPRPSDTIVIGVG